MSPTEMVVYWLVMPTSLIFAYKRIPLDNLLANSALWAVPYAIGMHVLLSEHSSGWSLWSGMAELMAMYGVLVYGGHRAEAWLARRKGG